MPWHTTKTVLKRTINQHGLKPMVEAGQICLEAERLYPSLFRAISTRNQYLHLELKKADCPKFKLIEGKLLEDLNGFAVANNLPQITRIRLTYSED